MRKMNVNFFIYPLNSVVILVTSFATAVARRSNREFLQLSNCSGRRQKVILFFQFATKSPILMQQIEMETRK